MKIFLEKPINKDVNFLDANSRKSSGPMKNKKNKRIQSKKKRIENLLKEY